MFTKLAAVMLVMLGLGAFVLTTRQASLQARSEQTQAYLRIQKADDHLLSLRSAIAMRVMPEAVRHMATSAGVGGLTPAIDELPPSLALQGLGTIEQMRAQLRDELLAFRSEESAKASKQQRKGATATSTSGNKKPSENASGKSRSAPATHPAEKTSTDKPSAKPGPSRIARSEV